MSPAHARAHRATWKELAHAAAHALVTGALRPEEMPYLIQLLRDLGDHSRAMAARISSHMETCGCAGCVEFAWRGKMLEAWDRDGQPGVSAPPAERVR